MTIKTYLPVILSVLSIATVLVIWASISQFGLVNPLFVPTPQTLWNAFVEIFQNGYKGSPIVVHIADSLYRLLSAFALALVTAVPLGL